MNHDDAVNKALDEWETCERKAAMWDELIAEASFVCVPNQPISPALADLLHDIALEINARGS